MPQPQGKDSVLQKRAGSRQARAHIRQRRAEWSSITGDQHAT
jgi:hypothetical protein